MAELEIPEDPAAIPRRLRRNIVLTLALGFFQVFMVFMPIAVPFFQSKGLSMQEVFTLQALFAALVLVFEVPSGYLADLLGRRCTLIAGAAFSGLGMTLLLLADGFWGLALFEASLAVAHSLISGADLAMLYETELALDRGEEQQRQVVGKLYGMRNASEALAGLVCSALLWFSDLDVVIVLQAVIGWLPLVLALALVEPPGRKPLHTGDGHLANMVVICRHLWRHSAVLRLCLLALSIWSLTTFYAVWLIQELWRLQGVALVHFGYLWAGLTFASLLAGRYAHRLEDWLGSSPILLFVGIAPAIGYLCLGGFGVTGALVASLSFFVSRGLGLVLLRDAFNRRVPSSIRATANSLASFGFRGAYVLTGPFIGYVYDLWDMWVTLLLLAALTLVIFAALILPLMVAVSAERRAVVVPVP